MFNELDADLQQELIAVFRIELEEKIQTIADHLLQLEKNPPSSEREAILEEIFHAAHSIKGASRGINLLSVADLSHCLESLFSALKKKPEQTSAEAIDAALTSLDFMRQAFEQFIHGHEPSAHQIQLVHAQLTQVTHDIQATDSKQSEQCQPSIAAKSHDIPSDQPSPRRRWRPPTKSVTNDYATPLPATPTTPPPPDQDSNQPTDNAPPLTVGESDLIHVAVEKLERLGSWTEEIHIALVDINDPQHKIRQIQAQTEILSQWLKTVNSVPPSIKKTILEIQSTTTAMRHELTTVSRQLKLLTHTMRDEILQMRLVKINTVTKPLPRMVRDLARELGKQVELEIKGDHLIIDRGILSLLRDPINHLLRNALDHGIETPSQRTAHNKSATGLITLHFSQTGHRMQIRVQDNGAGMNADEITRVALKKGVIDSQEALKLNHDQQLKLIFRPGFSSREILTTTSGRGVGLDVVQTNLHTIHGTVQVETQLGLGSTFWLDLPLTIATQRGLFVRVANRIMAIPSQQINRILLVHPAMKRRIENRNAILLDETPIPLVELADVMHLKTPKPRHFAAIVPAVILFNGWRTVAFLVDDALDDREMVIKKLPPPLWSVPNIAGATITGNGQVVTVLDPMALIESALQLTANTPLNQPNEEIAEIYAKKRILVVDDSITTRTLENNILTNAGYEVQLATNGLEAWEILQHQPFHLVVTDVQMPIMDGFQLTERIKTHQSYQEIPVIIVSSLGSQDDQQRGIEVGADAYIIKGQFETQALLEVVEQLIV